MDEQKLFHPQLDDVSASNLAIYRQWKADIKKNDRTPMDMVRFLRDMGQDEYASQVESFIQQMEDLSAGLA